MSDDLEIRLLRHFVVVAEELHFSRAAARLFVAQQALSRDIQRLESKVGMPLLDRTTRRVSLTPAGLTLLTHARELLALHDSTLRTVRGERRSVTVDVVGPGLTPAMVLATARQKASHVEFFARFLTGIEAAVPQLLTGQLDVTFGRNPDLPDGVLQRIVRYEPIAVLLPERHPLATLEAVPLESLRDTGVCIRAGNHATPGWEHAVLQLLAPFGVEAAGAHPHVQGADELAQHIHDRDSPILTMTTQPAVPGTVLRPVVDPIALFPWSMIWRADTNQAGLDALNKSADQLARTEHWLTAPNGAWLPEPEASHRKTKKRGSEVDDGLVGPIWFRALSSGDAALVHVLHSDPTTNVHNPFGASPDLRASEEMLEGWLQHRMDHGFGYELAFEGNRLAGICGARRDLWRDVPVINLYWRLLPDYLGKGLAGDLGRHALDVARSVTHLADELIVARMLPANAGSVRVAEKLGLTRRSDLDGEAKGVHWIVYAATAMVP